MSQPAPTAVLSHPEQALAEALSASRAHQYRWSRRWMRAVLADLFAVSPAAVPLDAPPGQAPSLADGWGFVSLSHCPDALAVAWAPWRIGVDLERSDREIPAEALLRRYFCRHEQEALAGMGGEALRQAVLRHWLLKEAAIKWQRGTLAQDLADWCCDRACERLTHQRHGTVVRSRCWQPGGWSLAVVGAEADVGDGANPMHATMLCLA